MAEAAVSSERHEDGDLLAALDEELDSWAEDATTSKGNDDEHRLLHAPETLQLLPKEILLRILSFVSAEDLAVTTACSKHLKSLASEEALWRRLYCARWGKPKQMQHNVPWKVQYFSRDSEDASKTMADVPEEMQTLYAEMLRAKRQTCLGRSHVDDMMDVPQNQLQEALSEWRRAHGFGTEHVPRPATLKKTFTRIGDMYCCDETGFIHVCDHTCREGVLDPNDGLLVCQISGRISPRFMTDREVRDMQRQDECVDDFAGGMGRAFVSGYYCSNERELRRRCGVRLSY